MQKDTSPPLRIMLIVVWLSTFSISKAQIAYSPDRVIPASPTAASLGAYGDYSVGYYTGKPDISIPLYLIKTNNHSVNLALNYDGAGVKASQQSTWVGLSWSIFSGGVITRTCRSLDDFEHQGYYNAGELPMNPTEENKGYFDEIANGRMDGEVDLYSYNFNNMAGRFVIGKKHDGSKVFMDKVNNLQVECIDGIKWIITGSDGYKYYFGTREYTRDDYSYSGEVELPDDAPLEHYQKSQKPPIVTSWYLDSIVSLNSETIKFIYEQKSSSLTPVQKSEKFCDLLYIEGGCTTAPRFTGKIYNYSSYRQVTLDIYLKKIVFTNGSVEFNTTDRTDIEYIDNEKPQKLSELIVKNINDKQIKKYVFKYGLFKNGRLKLNSVQEFDANNKAIPPYEFHYYDTGFPNLNSKSIDHWGFFNGRSNETLVPYKYLEEIPSNPMFFPGADKRSTTDVSKLKSCVISSIQYPSGGVTTFDFEINDYQNLSGDDMWDLAPDGATVYSDPGNQYQNSSKEIVLTKPTAVTIRWEYLKVDPNAPDRDNIEFNFASIEQGGHSVMSFSNWNCPMADDPTCGKKSFSTQVVLTSGTYTIRAWYIEGFRTQLSLTWNDRIKLTKRVGGGLRVSSIKNYENGKLVKARKFLYSFQGQTTGRLIPPLAYDYQYQLEDYPWGPGGGCDAYIGTYLARTSNNIYASGLCSTSAIVGYDLVTEIIGENGEGGKIEHTYYNYPQGIPPYPFLPLFTNPLNGKLKQSDIYDSKGTRLKKVEYDFTTKETSGLPSVKLYHETGNTEGETAYLISHYMDYSFWTVPTKETETEYSNGIGRATKKEIYYNSPVHKEMTSLKLTTSEGKIYTSKYKYPGDFSNPASSSFVKGMQAKNIITPIEEITLLKTNNVNKLVKGTFTEYKLHHNKFYSPSVLYEVNLDQPSDDTVQVEITNHTIVKNSHYKAELIIDSLDNRGNILAYHKPNNISEGYLWDYDSSLPIMRYSNASLAEVAFTSFEADGKGNWQYTGSTNSQSELAFGSRYYNLTSGAIGKQNLIRNKTYTISYWSDNGEYSISNTTLNKVDMLQSLNDWVLYKHTVTVSETSVSISGTGGIDELRLYPIESSIITFNYDPHIGIKSVADQNGIMQSFEYDSFNRLKLIRDESNGIFKRYSYFYQVR
jgi:hypothetical protein